MVSLLTLARAGSLFSNNSSGDFDIFITPLKFKRLNLMTSPYEKLLTYQDLVNRVPKLIVLYYSRTGNTEKMAKAIVEGAKKIQDVDVKLTFVATPEELASADAILIGMPTYHHDMTISMKRLLEETAFKGINLKGKVGASFGSYGWSGEAPHLILEVMENKFEMKVLKPPLLIKYTPDEEGLEECHRLGKNAAEQISKSSKT